MSHLAVALALPFGARELVTGPLTVRLRVADVGRFHACAIRGKKVAGDPFGIFHVVHSPPLATIAPTRSRLLSGRCAITFSRGPVDLAMIETTAGREALDSNGSGCDGSARTRGDWSRPPLRPQHSEGLGRASPADRRGRRTAADARRTSSRSRFPAVGRASGRS